MDFSKQLASLQRSAQSAAASSSGRGGGGGGGRGSGAADNRNNRKRGRDDYEDEYSSSLGGGGGGGWRGQQHHGQSHRDGGRRDNWRPHGGGGYRGRTHGGGGHGNSGGRREEDLTQLVQSILAKPHRQTIGAAADDAKKSTSASPATIKASKHLALLFLTIDDLPFEHIWTAWLAGAGGESSDGMTVSVLCHAKYPDRVKSDWLKQRLLIDKERSANAGGSGAGAGAGVDSKVHYLTRRPEWGSVEITRAMIDLVEEGLLIGETDKNVDEGAKSDSKSDATLASARRFISTPAHEDSTAPLPPVDQFIFVSETCLPVATLAEVQNTLFGSGADNSSTANASSWLKARNSPNNGYARQQQWDRMNRAIPTENIWKADQWILLIREHADAVARAGRGKPSSDASNTSNCNRVELWECFKRTRASDELYFPTVLSLLNIIGDQKRDGNENNNHADLGDNVANRRITYCDWSMSARNPASFNVLLEGRKAEFPEVVRKAREEGCLFARKFIAGDISGPGSRPPASSTVSAENEKFSAEKWIEVVTKFEKKLAIF